MTARVLRTVEGGVLTATLNRPEKRNAIDQQMIDGLLETLVEAELDPGVRVLVVRGAGKDFCAGMDLAELLESADRAPEENRRAALRLADVYLGVRRLPKPVVAGVHGRALAGGLGLVTACDIVVSTSSAQLGYPEIERGFVPALVLALLRRTVGEKQAFDLAATGRILGAEAAQAAGLVSRVIEDSKFEALLGALTAALARTSASALALLKRQFYELERRSLEEGLALGAGVNALSRTLPEFRTGLAAFLKR